jgi:alpha-glucosidase
VSPPFDLDGWRIDVANMTGRLRALDLNQAVARRTRDTIDHVQGDRWLLGEHFFDATADTPGDGWHGVMNYAGVSRPIASWLSRTGTLHGMSAGPGQDGRDGVGMARSLDVVRGSMAWTVQMGSMGLLSSHDTARWRTMCTGDDAAKVGFGMLLALPGAPCFMYGDEIGLTGANNDESRTPMPWQERARWDQEFLSWYRSVIAVRNASPAMQHGGFRWVHVDADQLVWIRESADDRVLIRAARADTHPVVIDRALLGASEIAPLLGDHRSDGDSISLPGDGPRFDVWQL